MGLGAAGTAAAIGAAGAVGGGAISALGSESAASTQAGAAKSAQQIQEQEQQQVRSDLLPYNTAGEAATNQLAGDLSGTNPTGELTQLQNTPGYNFALTQGLESTQNSAAARGLGTSGAALKGAANYAEGLAENTYQANLLNPLQSLSQTGESAAAQTGSLGTQGAANAGAAGIAAGNAGAAGTVGATNAIAGALGTASNSPLNFLLYQNLLGGAGTGAVDDGTF